VALNEDTVRTLSPFSSIRALGVHGREERAARRAFRGKESVGSGSPGNGMDWSSRVGWPFEPSCNQALREQVEVACQRAGRQSSGPCPGGILVLPASVQPMNRGRGMALATAA